MTGFGRDLANSLAATTTSAAIGAIAITAAGWITGKPVPQFYVPLLLAVGGGYGVILSGVRAIAFLKKQIKE